MFTSFALAVRLPRIINTSNSYHRVHTERYSHDPPHHISIFHIYNIIKFCDRTTSLPNGFQWRRDHDRLKFVALLINVCRRPGKCVVVVQRSSVRRPNKTNSIRSHLIEKQHWNIWRARRALTIFTRLSENHIFGRSHCCRRRSLAWCTCVLTK